MEPSQEGIFTVVKGGNKVDQGVLAWGEWRWDPHVREKGWPAYVSEPECVEPGEGFGKWLSIGGSNTGQIRSPSSQKDGLV